MAACFPRCHMSQNHEPRIARIFTDNATCSMAGRDGADHENHGHMRPEGEILSKESLESDGRTEIGLRAKSALGLHVRFMNTDSKT
jgi:hypothetical protein